MAANHGYIDIDGERIADITRRINGGGFYFPAPPPPPIPQIPTEEPTPPMVADVVDKITKEQPRNVPTTTSSLIQERVCGTTVSDFATEITNEKKDPLVLNHLPLKKILTRVFPWILDITEVRIIPNGGINRAMEMLNQSPNSSKIKIFGRIQIHITVSPTHYSELMNPNIERKVRDQLYKEILPLVTCMFEDNNKDKPSIIFSPEHSETILEYVK
jgi:hypothetical protein